MRPCGETFNMNLVLLLARKLLQSCKGDAYSPSIRVSKSEQVLSEHLNTKWMERFLFSSRIVSRVQTGKLLTIVKKRELIEWEAEFHLGEIKRTFYARTLDKIGIFNSDETDLIVDINDGRTLAMKGENVVKFGDVVSGDVVMNIMVMQGVAPGYALIFQWWCSKMKKCSHPIQGVPDDVPGVFTVVDRNYGWILMYLWSGLVKRIMNPFYYSNQRILVVENASGHDITDKAQSALHSTRTEQNCFKKYGTDLC